MQRCSGDVHLMMLLARGDDELDYHSVFDAESRGLGSNVYMGSVLPG